MKAILILIVLCIVAAVVGYSKCQSSNALFNAVEQGRIDEITSLLDQKPGLVKKTNYRKETPLHIASKTGNVEMAELLILARKTGVDPRRVVDAIQGGAAQCWTLDNKPARLFDGSRSLGSKAN